MPLSELAIGFNFVGHGTDDTKWRGVTRHGCLERRKEFGRSTFERELRTARKKHETPEEYAR